MTFLTRDASRLGAYDFSALLDTKYQTALAKTVRSIVNRARTFVSENFEAEPIAQIVIESRLMSSNELRRSDIAIGRDINSIYYLSVSSIIAPFAERGVFFAHARDAAMSWVRTDVTDDNPINDIPPMRPYPIARFTDSATNPPQKPKK